jgi:nucleoside-diphosphate-sugar epimerase
MNKKRPGHLPGFLVKLVIGPDLYEVVSMNCIASNEKAKKILNWHPEFPSYKEGLLKVIEEIREGPNYFDRD